MEDQRFQSFVKDPRCRDIPKNVRKVKVDKRFQKMLKHKQFKGNNRIDERGRKINFSTSEKLKKLYQLKDSSNEDDSSSENSEDDQDKLKEKISPLQKKEMNEAKIVKSVDVSEDDLKTLQNRKNKRIHKDKSKVPKVISDLPKSAESLNDNTHLSEGEEESIGSEELQNCENDVVTVQKHKDVQKQKIITKNLKSKKSDNLSEENLSDSSEEDISDSDDSEDSDSATDIFADPDEFDHNWEEWNDQAPDTDEISKRLAVCNMDWDRIRADDLLIVFNSFKPAGGTINSVKIYPSEFGLKRMDAERLNGPPELVEETLDPEAEEKLDKRRAKFHREKLREYQLKRLQYYYAVVDCDSAETADHLYIELNGKEYESSSVRFDLRFVPDDTTFDQTPISEASKIPDPSEYRPRYFVSTALGQAKVDLTWDETDPQRQEILDRAFKEPDNIEKDIKDYLASSSAESEEEQADDPEDGKNMKLNERISKYKELLQSLEEKGKEEDEKYDMEISWQPDLKEKTEKLVKQKLEEPKNPFQEMIQKKKERKLKKQKKSSNNKADEESGSASDEDYSDNSADEKPTETENKKLDELFLISDSKKAFDETQEKCSKKKKKKNKQQKSAPEKIQDFKFVEDERFSAIYTSAEFNLDPSDPHFKKTEGNLAFIQEKQRRLKTKGPPTDSNRKSKKAKHW